MIKIRSSTSWQQSKTLILDSMNSPVQTKSLCKLPFMSDDHSKVVPLLPIPNRTVKRFCADDSAGSRVKVGHRQTLTASISPTDLNSVGLLCLVKTSCQVPLL